MKIKSWTLLLNFGRNPEYYYFDSSNWDVSSKELDLCIDEQVYRGLKKDEGGK